jgi:biotin operon repressor
MAMNKKEATAILIKAGFIEEEIENMKWTEIRKKAAEVLIEEEKAAVDVLDVITKAEEEKAEEKKTAPKKKKAEEVLDKTAKIKEKKTTPKKKKETNKIIGACGFEFDPSENSECNTECKFEFDEDYAECCKQYKKLEEKLKIEKENKKKEIKGKSVFGHLLKSQSGKIDMALLEGDTPVNIKELAKELETSPTRVSGHIRVLINKKGVEVFENKNGEVFLPERFKKEKGKLFK